MLSLVKNELIKLFAGKKIYVFMLAIVLGNSLIGVESLVGAIDIPVNGQNVPILMLPTIVNILLPLFVIVLVAGMITDEYVNGTLKLSLIHPVSRTSLLTAKLLALGVILLYLLAFALLVSYVLGTVFFGWGEQFTYNDEVYTTTAGIIMTVGSYFISSLPLLTFGTIAMLISLKFSSGGATVGATLGLLLLLAFLGEVIEVIRPYLFVGYFRQLAVHVFETGDLVRIVLGFLVMAGYGITAYLVSIYLFKKKDLAY